jgi:hypothetical protein
MDQTMAALGIVDPNCDPTITICQAVSSTVDSTTSTVGSLLP